MKTRISTPTATLAKDICAAVTTFVAVLASCFATADRLCPPLYVGGFPSPCPITVEFERAVDLDGDSVADFIHARFAAQNHQDFYGASNTWVGYIHQDDSIEAFFPEPHLEMYWLIWGPTFVDPEPRLSAGHELLPEPLLQSPGRYGSWGLPEPAHGKVYPRFEAEGIGIINRQYDEQPCEPKPRVCRGGVATGYMWQPADPWWTMPKSDRYFGFRIACPDGWHLGWLHLKWEALAEGPVPAPLTLAGYAVHPEPDTAIVVGEPARPTLGAERSGTDLVLRWSPVWTNAVLQRTPGVGSSVWEPVPGVTNNAVRLPATSPQGFFRLRTP